MSRKRSILLAAVVALLAVAVFVVWRYDLLSSWAAEPAPRLAPAPAPLAEGQIDIRVMSFNILDATKRLRITRWDQRKALAVEVINAFDPDLLGTQEAQPFQAAYLDQHLPGHQLVGVGRRDGRDEGQFVAIFFKRDRFEKLAEGHFWLSETPDVPGSKDWLSPVPRVVSWVKLRSRSRPAPAFFYFNTHVDPVSVWARNESAVLLRKRVAAIAGHAPVIVTGDFNSNEGTKCYRLMLDDSDGLGLGLIDSYRRVHPLEQGNEGTWHGPGGIRPDRRIDWILHTPHFVPIAAGIDRTQKDGQYPSDHFPVTAVLRLSGLPDDR